MPIWRTMPGAGSGWRAQGADAAPFFRIFNPITQGEKFDPDGEYVRRWVPELAKLPSKWIHKPWDAPGEVLAEADVRLGENYPEPMVDHKGPGPGRWRPTRRSSPKKVETPQGL